jgi:hypothetical protein
VRQNLNPQFEEEKADISSPEHGFNVVLTDRKSLNRVTFAILGFIFQSLAHELPHALEDILRDTDGDIHAFITAFYLTFTGRIGVSNMVDIVTARHPNGNPNPVHHLTMAIARQLRIDLLEQHIDIDFDESIIGEANERALFNNFLNPDNSRWPKIEYDQYALDIIQRAQDIFERSATHVNDQKPNIRQASPSDIVEPLDNSVTDRNVGLRRRRNSALNNPLGITGADIVGANSLVRDSPIMQAAHQSPQQQSPQQIEQAAQEQEPEPRIEPPQQPHPQQPPPQQVPQPILNEEQAKAEAEALEAGHIGDPNNDPVVHPFPGGAPDQQEGAADAIQHAMDGNNNPPLPGAGGMGGDDAEMNGEDGVQQENNRVFQAGMAAFGAGAGAAVARGAFANFGDDQNEGGGGGGGGGSGSGGGGGGGNGDGGGGGGDGDGGGNGDADEDEDGIYDDDGDFGDGAGDGDDNNNDHAVVIGGNQPPINNEGGLGGPGVAVGGAGGGRGSNARRVDPLKALDAEFAAAAFPVIYRSAANFYMVYKDFSTLDSLFEDPLYRKLSVKGLRSVADKSTQELHSGCIAILTLYGRALGISNRTPITHMRSGLVAMFKEYAELRQHVVAYTRYAKWSMGMYNSTNGTPPDQPMADDFDVIPRPDPDSADGLPPGMTAAMLAGTQYLSGATSGQSIGIVGSLTNTNAKEIFDGLKKRSIDLAEHPLLLNEYKQLHHGQGLNGPAVPVPVLPLVGSDNAPGRLRGPLGNEVRAYPTNEQIIANALRQSNAAAPLFPANRRPRF